MSAGPDLAAQGGLTRALAGYAAGLADADVPADARAAARRAMIDCLGGALAGCHDAVTQSAAATLGLAEGECTLWGSPLRASAGDAALVNGCAAHAHALDDTHESMRGHPSAPVVPAILALGETVDADGTQLETAYIAGVEVAGRLGRCVNDRHSQLGWHTTATLGTVGAAAACARLLGLDARATGHALGLASSMAGGLRVNFGTPTKALHAGLAARNGVLAARLAANGMTASPQALEGHEGFLQLFCDDGSQDPVRGLRAPGTDFEVLAPGVVYKRFPTCSLMHALVDMVLEARAQGCFAREDGMEIRCEISRRLDDARTHALPGTGLQAKFHVEYCVAVAASRGTQGIDDFTDPALERADVQRWMRRVTLRTGQDFPAGNGDYAVLTVLRDGRELFRRAQAKPIGHPSMPMTLAQHEAKFMHCAERALPAATAAALWTSLNAPVPMPARALAAALNAASTPASARLT